MDHRDAFVHILRKAQIAGAKKRPLVETQAIQAVHDAVDVIYDQKSALHGICYCGQSAVEGVVNPDSQTEDHQSQTESEPDNSKIFD